MYENFDNYDHIDKILRSLSRKWRPQVTTLRALKNLDTMFLEELFGTLKNFKKMKELRRENVLLSMPKKAKKTPLSKESSSRSSSKVTPKALSVDNSSNEESNEDDELAFISRKIRKIWKNSSKRVFKEKDNRENSFIICYECKSGHFKTECPKLEKSKDKYKHYKSKDKKSIMSTWEDLDDTTSNEEGEEELKELNELQDHLTQEKQPLSKFVGGSENFDKLLRYSRCPIDNFGHWYEGEKYVHDKDTVVCYFCRKAHMRSKCKDLPKKGASNAFRTNKRGPKKLWVPKNKIIHVACVLDSKKRLPTMVPGQWQLTTHDKRKSLGRLLYILLKIFVIGVALVSYLTIVSQLEARLHATLLWREKK
ncbi:hypothetical protein HKD37_15G043299 [Glycine soja]